MQIHTMIKYLLVTIMTVVVTYSGKNSMSDTARPTPVISLHGENPQVIEKGDAYTELGASLSINDGSTIRIDIHDVNTSMVGNYYVKYYGIGKFSYILPLIRKVKVIDSSSWIGTYKTEKHTSYITLSSDNKRAYIIKEGVGLEIVDIRTPSHPKFLGLFNIESLSHKVSLSPDGSKAYIINNKKGLMVIDISNPSSPQLVATLNIKPVANDIAISHDGTKLYIVGEQAGLQIIDVTVARHPKILSISYMGDDGDSIVLSPNGRKVYMVNNETLRIIDIRIHATPVLLATLDIEGNDYVNNITLSLDGTKAYVASGSEGLRIVDVSVPTNPKILATLKVATFLGANYASIKNVTLSPDGTKAYLASSTQGIQIVDVSIPVNPKILARLNMADAVYSIAISNNGNKAYVADGRAGVQIIDIAALLGMTSNIK